MHLALINGFQGGHHLTYARLYARALAEMGHEIDVLVPDPGAVQDWLRERDGGWLKNVCFHTFSTSEGHRFTGLARRYVDPVVRWLHAARGVKYAARVRGQSPDGVFFIWLDDYLEPGSRALGKLLPAIFPWPWSGLYYHPRHLRNLPRGLDSASVEAESTLAAANCRSVAVLDEGVRSGLADRIGKPVVFLPDVTDESVPSVETSLCADVRRSARGRPIVGLIGGMERRKSVMEMLSVMERHPEWYFLFAGTLGDGAAETFHPAELQRLRRLAASPPDNAWFCLERINDESRFNALFRICSVVVAVYHDFPHSSGILTKAAVFGCPVVVAEGYFMAERVRDYRLGVTVPERNPQAIEAALSCLLDPECFRLRIGDPRFADYRTAHSGVRLREAFGEIVRAY